jgi:multicomponent K+:H+ antiporter subunit D
MSHALILPILVPIVAAVAILALERAGLSLVRAVSLTSVLVLAVLALHLLVLAGDGEVRTYRLGDWPPPYGIVLVLDRLAAFMLALTAAVALPALLYAIAGTDGEARHFHALYQLQLAGLAGAFLTGDLFNLFVFFEVLLLASYGLLVHGGGLARSRAGLAYVVLNLSGSTLFLVGLGLLYGLLGTLNLADVATVLPAVPPDNGAAVRVALVLLVVVFALKAALLPLSFWLPHAYAAAPAPVAALFAIMTKVGIYALMRLAAVAFPAAPFTASLLEPWLAPLALSTVAIGMAGALAATRLAAVAANLVLVSTGTLLVAVAAGDAETSAALLFYLAHSTLATAGLFLLAHRIAQGRGALGDALVRGPVVTGAGALGVAYLVLAVAVSGMPPLSGFLGKVMLMQSLRTWPWGPPLWAALLLSGLAAALVLARGASVLFWEPGRPTGRGPVPSPFGNGKRAAATALVLLVAASPLLAAAARPVAQYAEAAARQLHDREAYVAAVLGKPPVIERERRP